MQCNMNKTWTPLKTNGSKDEPNIVVLLIKSLLVQNKVIKLFLNLMDYEFCFDKIFWKGTIWGNYITELYNIYGKNTVTWNDGFLGKLM